jgi:hypothetical protein
MMMRGIGLPQLFVLFLAVMLWAAYRSRGSE